MTEDKKVALKAAALDIFGQKGYKATGISEIARQAKVAVGSSAKLCIRYFLLFSCSI